MSTLMERYETTEQKLEDKCSVTEAVKLDSRQLAPEPKMCNFEHKLNQNLAPLETRVNILEQKLSTTFTAIAKPSHDNGLSHEDLIKFVVQDKLNMKTEEKDFASRQKCNISSGPRRAI